VHISDLLISFYESNVFFYAYFWPTYIYLRKYRIFLHISDLLISPSEIFVVFAYFWPTYICLRKYHIFLCIFLTYLYLLMKVSFFFIFSTHLYLLVSKVSYCFAYFRPNYIYFYYIMILFKQFYWLSCCRHLTFRKIWYCLNKTRIDLVSLSFSNEIYQKNHVNSISIRPMNIKVMWNFVQSESSY
jgi:hypothetical protein